MLVLTNAGRAVAEFPDVPPTVTEIHDAWRRCPAFRPAHVRILDVLIERYPRPVSREDLADAVGLSPNSSSFQNDVSRLSSLGVAEYPAPGMVTATALLFPEGL